MRKNQQFSKICFEELPSRRQSIWDRWIVKRRLQWVFRPRFQEGNLKYRFH